MLDFDVIRPIFEQKMDMIKVQTKTHPKMKLLMAGGPEFADWAYEAMFAVFCSGYDEGSKLYETV